MKTSWWEFAIVFGTMAGLGFLIDTHNSRLQKLEAEQYQRNLQVGTFINRTNDQLKFALIQYIIMCPPGTPKEIFCLAVQKSNKPTEPNVVFPAKN